MGNRDIVVIGGSAGAGQAIKSLLRRLPPDLPAAIFIVVHLDPSDNGVFANNLSYDAALPVEVPGLRSTISHGRIYVCRSDHHLIIEGDSAHSVRGPRENMWRPAIDVLFRSAAVHCGSRVIALLLSGDLDDGTSGMKAVKDCGGVTVLQDRNEADFPAMLESAAEYVEIDHEVGVDELPGLIAALVAEPAPEFSPPSQQLIAEAALARATTRRHDPEYRNEQPSIFTCPECGGPLWPAHDTGMRFRCLVGHTYQAGTLLKGTDEEVERSLWAAVRLFEQRMRLERRLAQDEAEKGRRIRSELYAERAGESERYIETLRKLLEAARARP